MVDSHISKHILPKKRQSPTTAASKLAGVPSAGGLEDTAANTNDTVIDHNYTVDKTHTNYLP